MGRDEVGDPGEAGGDPGTGTAPPAQPAPGKGGRSQASLLGAAALFLFFAVLLTWSTGTGLVEVWRLGGEGWATLLLPGVFTVGALAGFLNVAMRYAVVRRAATEPRSRSPTRPTGPDGSVGRTGEQPIVRPPEAEAAAPLHIQVYDETTVPEPAPSGRWFAEQVGEIRRRRTREVVARVTLVLGASLLAVVTGPDLAGAGGLAACTGLFAVLLGLGAILGPRSRLLGWWTLLQLAALATSAVVALSGAASFSRAPSPAAAGAVALVALSWTVWFLALRRSAARADSAWGSGSPPLLLSLWAFDETASDTMRWLHAWVFGMWRLVGPVWQLRGPGWEPYGVADALRWLGGRSEAVLLDSPRAVRTRLQASEARPGLGLGLPTYPVEYVTATDETWKLAVRRLIDRADVILVDLRGFGTGSAGVEHELDEILRWVPVERVLLAVDDSTAMEHLHSVLRASWAALPPSSPNRRPDPGPVVRAYRFSTTLSDFTPDDELRWDVRLFGVSLNPRSRASSARLSYDVSGGRDASVLTRLVIDAAGAALHPPA